MKKINLIIVSIALIFSSCTDNATYKTPETEMEKVSYSIAVNMAKSLKSQGLDSFDEPLTLHYSIALCTEELQYCQGTTQAYY